jgi:hypothetical protein
VRGGVTDLPPQQRILPFRRTCATIRSIVAPTPLDLHPTPIESFERFGWDFWQNNTTSLLSKFDQCGTIDYASSIVALYLCRSRASSTERLRAYRTMASSLGFAH